MGEHRGTDAGHRVARLQQAKIVVVAFKDGAPDEGGDGGGASHMEPDPSGVAHGGQTVRLHQFLVLHVVAVNVFYVHDQAIEQIGIANRHGQMAFPWIGEREISGSGAAGGMQNGQEIARQADALVEKAVSPFHRQFVVGAEFGAAGGAVVLAQLHHRSHESLFRQVSFQRVGEVLAGGEGRYAFDPQNAVPAHALEAGVWRGACGRAGR